MHAWGKPFFFFFFPHSYLVLSSLDQEWKVRKILSIFNAGRLFYQDTGPIEYSHPRTPGHLFTVNDISFPEEPNSTTSGMIKSPILEILWSLNYHLNLGGSLLKCSTAPTVRFCMESLQKPTLAAMLLVQLDSERVGSRGELKLGGLPGLETFSEEQEKKLGGILCHESRKNFLLSLSAWRALSPTSSRNWSYLKSISLRIHKEYRMRAQKTMLHMKEEK